MKDADMRGMCSAHDTDGKCAGCNILVTNPKKKKTLVTIKRMRAVDIGYRARATQQYEYHEFITFTATCFGRRTRPSSGRNTNP
jgi:hypothetical protein